jgi:[acyl-carrier-protein] S-malonyltransferase
MGKELYDRSPAARKIFDQAGEDVKKWCFEGTKEELRQTHVTQPSVFTVSVAACDAFFEAWKQEGVPAPGEPAGTGAFSVTGLAGFSMGEYAALYAGGCFKDFETALALLAKRGEYMAQAGKYADGSPRGAMLAVFGERAAILECVAAVASVQGDDVLEAVNFNAPGQTVVAGDQDAVSRLREKIKGTAGLKAVPLNVSTAFHSAIMEPASPKFAAHVSGFDFSAPKIPVYSNITGRPLMADKPQGETDADWIRGRLALQLKNPVYWQETIENMIADGVGLFIEFGPGQTLTGLVKKIDGTAAALHVEDAESLTATVAAVKALLG